MRPACCSAARLRSISRGRRIHRHPPAAEGLKASVCAKAGVNAFEQPENEVKRVILNIAVVAQVARCGALFEAQEKSAIFAAGLLNCLANGSAP